MTSNNIKVAYVHPLTYPSLQANTRQAMAMASAFSQISDTLFFIPRLTISKSELKRRHNISELNLRILPMYLDQLPSRFSSYFDQFVSTYLRFHPQWASFQGQKILFVRVPKELLYWGLQREHQQKWFKDWTFIFEAHDALGLDPSRFQRKNPFELKEGAEGQYHQSLLKALLNFNQIICVSQALADDLISWSNYAIKPTVVSHSSSLHRSASPPQIRFGENIVLGYIGTIDRYRGVNILLDAMYHLPQNYRLRMVGRFRQEEGVDPNWLDKYLNDTLIKDRVELVNAVPVQDVAREIDRCDILLQPASSDIMYSRYASPLKSYDYMMRGKPIIAADIPGHHVLFNDGESAFFYHLDPRDLAECIINLAKHPDQAERIARAGWEQAVEYTYQRRAEKILSLAEGCRNNKKN